MHTSMAVANGRNDNQGHFVDRIRVESPQGNSTMSDLSEHFNQRARRILILAQEEAERLQHRQIEPIHILLGVTADGKGLATDALTELDCDLRALRRRVEECAPRGDKALWGKPKLADPAKTVLKVALQIANDMGHRYIGSEHLLLALLEDADDIASQILQEFVDKADVIAKLTDLLTGGLLRTRLSQIQNYFRVEQAIVVTEKGEKPAVTALDFPRALLSAWQEQSRLQIYESAVQEERSRLARDLHDAVKQQLFSINLSAAAVRERIDQDRAGAMAALGDVQQAAIAALAEINALLRQLSPTPLATAGLLEALKEQCEALGFRTGATVVHRFGALPGADQLPLGAQETLFRIVQEAFSNIARHARAVHVHLQLEYVADEALVRLEIQDDGQGFDQAQTTSGMGLLNIETRTHQLKGHAQIQSMVGQGAQIRVDIPLLPKAEPEEDE